MGIQKRTKLVISVIAVFPKEEGITFEVSHYFQGVPTFWGGVVTFGALLYYDIAVSALGPAFVLGK